MGKYPFMTAANDYLELMKDVLKETTWNEYERRYRKMQKDLQALAEAGKISSVNPLKMMEGDVLAYLSSLRARGMADSGIAHNVDSLAALLRFVGNNALDRARLKSPQHFPRYGKPRLDPIPKDDRRTIIEAATRVPDDNWQQMVAYAIAVAGICSGLRPGELRLARIGDIDLRKGILHAEEVKGKDRYGEPRNAAIHPDGIPFLRRYVHARNRNIAVRAPLNDFLFPAIRDSKAGGDGNYSQQGMSKLRKIVQEDTGVAFDGRACRRTYGQVSIDSGVPLDAVSRMLGHRTTKTTETYYCRRSNEAAIEEAQKVWGNIPTPKPDLSRAENPLIRKIFEPSGYA